MTKKPLDEIKTAEVCEKPENSDDAVGLVLLARTVTVGLLKSTSGNKRIVFEGHYLPNGQNYFVKDKVTLI